MVLTKEINTFIGLSFAASRSSSPNPEQYQKEFATALNEYFKCYPNPDASEDSSTVGNFPVDE